MINVLLIDDHAVVRTGYKTFLSLSDDIGEIFEADRGEVACQIVDDFAPDVVVCDLSMPGIGGFETMRRLFSRHPSVRILVFSIHDEPVYIQRALKLGVSGYINKTCPPEMLVDAVRKIFHGERFIAPDLAQKLALSVTRENDAAENIKQLTAREFDVFCLLANGKTQREAASKMCLSYKTVCNHSTAIKEKMGLKSLAEMTLLASNLGLLEQSNLNDFT